LEPCEEVFQVSLCWFLSKIMAELGENPCLGGAQKPRTANRSHNQASSEAFFVVSGDEIDIPGVLCYNKKRIRCNQHLRDFGCIP
jgi:hypothetical protein